MSIGKKRKLFLLQNSLKGRSDFGSKRTLYFLNSKNFKYFFIDQIGAFSASLLVKRNNLCKRGRSKTTGEEG